MFNLNNELAVSYGTIYNGNDAPLKSFICGEVAINIRQEARVIAQLKLGAYLAKSWSWYHDHFIFARESVIDCLVRK